MCVMKLATDQCHRPEASKAERSTKKQQSHLGSGDICQRYMEFFQSADYQESIFRLFAPEHSLKLNMSM